MIRWASSDSLPIISSASLLPATGVQMTSRVYEPSRDFAIRATGAGALPAAGFADAALDGAAGASARLGAVAEQAPSEAISAITAATF